MNITRKAQEIDRERGIVSREIKRNSKLMYREDGATYLKYSAVDKLERAYVRIFIKFFKTITTDRRTTFRNM